MEVAVPDLAGSLGGGGRYDGLIGMFLGEDVPACGFSLGLERILVVMNERKMFPPEVEQTSADVLLTLFDEATIPEVVEAGGGVARGGIRVEVYPEPDKLGKQMKYASTRRFASPRFSVATRSRAVKSRSRISNTDNRSPCRVAESQLADIRTMGQSMEAGSRTAAQSRSLCK